MRISFAILCINMILNVTAQDSSYLEKKTIILKNAEIYKTSGQYDKALSTLLSLEKLKPEQSPQYYFNVGELYYLLGEYSDARVYFRKGKFLIGSKGKLSSICNLYILKSDSNINAIEQNPELEYGRIYEFAECDVKAEFPGGYSQLDKFISENCKYPEAYIQECSIEGTVYVRLILTKTGKIDRIRVMRETNPFFEQEATRIIKSMPQWKPSEIDGKPINSWLIIPVKFRL